MKPSDASDDANPNECRNGRPAGRNAVTRYEKPQAGNPHRLTVRQHVIPVASIRRFVSNNNSVSLFHLGRRKFVPVKPDNPLFCAARAWDQRAESGFMRQIENRFQEVARYVLAGSDELSPSQCRSVTEFWALWQLRHRFKKMSLPGQNVTGVGGEPRNTDQQEFLESKHVAFVAEDNTISGRTLGGVVIQKEVDRLAFIHGDLTWVATRACNGELIHPDTFGAILSIPVSPTVELIVGPQPKDLSWKNVADRNRIALAAAQEFVFAKDFEHCPVTPDQPQLDLPCDAINVDRSRIRC